MHERYSRCFLEMRLRATFLGLNTFQAQLSGLTLTRFTSMTRTSSRLFILQGNLKSTDGITNSGVSEVSFGTEDHNVHRQRVSTYGDPFSIKSLLAFNQIIKANVTKLCEKLDQHAESGLPINLSHEYQVLTLGTITSYIGLGPAPLLNEKDLGKSYREYGRGLAGTSVLVRHFRFLTWFRFLPQTFVASLSSKFGIIKDHLDVCQYSIPRNLFLMLG